MNQLLSKSKYLKGLQCPKYLWTAVNEPENITEPDNTTQHLFDQGILVGELAKGLFPNGIDVLAEDFNSSINFTKELLRERKPLFEASICIDDLYCRIDILNPIGEGKWEIIEVKSSTKPKEVNIHDVSFQKLCCEKAGLSIESCKLAYINTQYIKNGEIRAKDLFIVENISSQIDLVSEGIEERVRSMLTLIQADKYPDIGIGKHCLKPYECMLRPICWGCLPEDSIFDLRGGKTKQFSLYDQGILSIKDIPDEVVLSRQQKIQKECVITGNTYVEKEEIQQFLSRLVYPYYYLDFETIGPAIPIYEGTRPYQTLPFQFSLHVVENNGSEPVHYAFLSDGKEDPRPQLLGELKKLLGSVGSIIAYNSGFEEGVLRELVEAYPEYADWFEEIRVRIVDLLFPFTNFHYYHASQKDTASLKKVLPAITGKGYDDMGIGAGMDASITFEKIICGNLTHEEIAKTRADLLEYCKLDTEGMIWIVQKLRELG